MEQQIRTELGVLDSATGREFIDYGGDQMEVVQHPVEGGAAAVAAPLAGQVEVQQ